MAQINTGIFYESSKLPRLNKYDQLIIFYEDGSVINYVVDYIVKLSKDAGYIYLCDTSETLSQDEINKLNRIKNVAYLPGLKLAQPTFNKNGRLTGVAFDDGTKLHCTKVLVVKGE